MTLSVSQEQQLNTYLRNNPRVSREQAIEQLFGGATHVAGATGQTLFKPVGGGAFSVASSTPLFGFKPSSAGVGTNVQKTTTDSDYLDVYSEPFTYEEVKEAGVSLFAENVKSARKLYDSQNNSQGSVSNTVNEIKENLDTSYASSRVNRIINREELTAEVLDLAKDGKLSECEYYEKKLDLAVSLLPKVMTAERKGKISEFLLKIGSAGPLGQIALLFKDAPEGEKEQLLLQAEVELLKKTLAQLPPEELENTISKIVSSNDETFLQQGVDSLLNSQLEIETDRLRSGRPDTLTSYFEIGDMPGSVAEIIKSSTKSLTLQDTFLRERGVEFNPQAIENYARKEQYVNFLVKMNNRNVAIKESLRADTAAVQYRITQPEEAQRGVNDKSVSDLKTNLQEVLNSLYNGDSAKINELLETNYGTFDISKMTEGQLVKLSLDLQSTLDNNFEQLLDGKTIEDYSNELKTAYRGAYGSKNASDIADAFAQSQQEGVQYLKTALQVGGAVIMVGGQLIPVAGQTALVWGGMALSTLGGVGTSAIENYTKDGGPTQQDKEEMIKELGISLAMVGSGMVAGKLGEMAHAAVLLKNCPKVLAYMNEVGVDAATSVLADYAITGQVDLSSEGIAQLQGLLVGLARVKFNPKKFFDTHAGQATTKTQDKTDSQKVHQSPAVQKQPEFEINESGEIVWKNGDPTVKTEVEVVGYTKADNLPILKGQDDNAIAAKRKSINEKTLLSKREALKARLMSGQKVILHENGISVAKIPKGTLAAPSAKFAGTQEAYQKMLWDSANDIAFLNKYVKDKAIIAKALNEIGNDGMDFRGIEHPFTIDNIMGDRGLTSFDGSSAVSINTTRFGLPSEFENDIAEMAHRVFHEKRHVFQNIQRSLGFGEPETGLEPLQLYSNDLVEGSVNTLNNTYSQFYNHLKNNGYDYKVTQDGRFPRNIEKQDINYGMSVSESQANYISSGPEYWTQFVENDAENYVGLFVGRTVENIIKCVEPHPSRTSFIAKCAYCAQKLDMDFDVVFRNEPEVVNDIFFTLLN